MKIQRNKEMIKACCKQPTNIVLRPYTDGTADLRCKKCGHIMKAFDAQIKKESHNDETLSPK